MLARHRHVLVAYRHARQVQVDQHRADCRRRGGGIRHAHDDGKVRERCAADVVLAAVDHQLVAIGDRGGLDALRVGAGMRFGQCEAGRLLAADDRLEVLLQLRRRGVLEHVAHARRAAQVAQHMRGQRRAAGGQVSLERALLLDVQPLAAERFRQAGGIEAQLVRAAPDLAQHFARPRVFGAEAQFLLQRAQLCVDKAADAGAGFHQNRVGQMIEHDRRAP
ncbi:hypothetical protein D9M72_434200 [compost metagenome]